MTQASALRQFRLAEACREALDLVWLNLNPDAVERYRRALIAMVRTQRANHPWSRLSTASEIPFPRVGPYVLERVLGLGGNGIACLAHHDTTGQLVTVKLNSGSEGVVSDWLDGDLPPQFVRIYDHGQFDDPISGVQWPWVAREYAPGGTWARSPEPDVALEVFVLACTGVAALHERGVHGWSAHERNVLRTTDGWRLADMGRCTVGMTIGDERLRQDDCSMLAGLLCDLLGINRWETFLAFLRGRRRYVLTGQHQVDRALSGVLSRAWDGDAGGVFGDGYDDALELLADVEDALVSTNTQNI